MGWTSGWESRQAVVRHIKERYERDDGSHCKILRASLVGNHLWMALEFEKDYSFGGKLYAEAGHRWIGLWLLSGKFGQGRTDGTWGYKDMDESSHPYYFDCPLYLLDMVAPAAPEWRKQVRAYHRAKTRQFQPGDEVWLPEGCTPRHFVITSNKPLRGRAYNIDESRGFFRLTRTEILEHAPEPVTA